MRYHYTITKYAELRQWAKKFAIGDIHSLVLFGNAGVGKSETVQNALADDDLKYIAGRLSAYQLFASIRSNPGSLFLFDDTRRLLKDAECVNLLMQLAEHKKVKSIHWHTRSSSASSEEDCVCETTSRMALVINRVDQANEDLEPIFSRSILLLFQPSKKEVHDYVGKWFLKDRKSREIYDFIGGHIDLIPQPDIRDYTKSLSVYDMPWKNMLLQSWTQDEYTTVALKILNDRSIPDGQEQVRAFAAECGGSRDTFYRLKRKLLPGVESGKR